MKFNESHTWAKVDQSTATVGISDFAQKELGEIVYVELPKIGSKVKQGDEIAVLESTKSAVDIYTPLSGEIIEINHTLFTTPEKINHSSQDEGWLYKMKITEPHEYSLLLDEVTYNRLT